MRTLELIINPVNPIDFVGRKKLIDRIFEWLMQFTSNSLQNNWVHIYGKGGSGKSSLLRKYKDMAAIERIQVFDHEIPISRDGVERFFDELKETIDIVAPDWRSFIQKKTKQSIGTIPVEMYEVVYGSEISDEQKASFISIFFENLDKANAKLVEEKKRLAIFLDDIDKFANYGAEAAIMLLQEIAYEFKKRNYNIVIFSTSTPEILDLLTLNDELVSLVQVEAFSFSDAKIMLNRRKIARGNLDEIIQNSTRDPFDLAMRETLFDANKDVRNLSPEVIAEVFELNDAEVSLLQNLSSHSKNVFSKEEVLKASSKKTIDDLVKKLILTRSQNYLAFTSQAFWELVSINFLPTDPRTELILILNRMEHQAKLGNLPITQDIQLIRANIAAINDVALIVELASQLEDTATAALEGNLVSAAWDILQIAVLALEKTQDFEKLGDLQAEFGNKFALKGHEYFAALAYLYSAVNYTKLPRKQRETIDSYREAGNRFKREAEKIDVSTNHYALRSIYKKSVNAYLQANEHSDAKEVLRIANNNLKDYPQHIAYLNKIEI